MAEARRLKTLVVDDEPLAIERLQILCAQLPELLLVGAASGGEAALRLTEALKPDLVLLDIGMPDLDGIRVAENLAECSPDAAIIFITAYDQFAVSAFDIGAVDYLLKPVLLDRLRKAVMRVRSKMEEGLKQSSSKSEEFWVTHRAQIIRVAACDIELIEAERDYMRLHVKDRSYLMHETITQLEQRLDAALFIRIHRSTIVRRDMISALSHDGDGNWQLALRDGRALRIGRTYLSSVRAIIGK